MEHADPTALAVLLLVTGLAVVTVCLVLAIGRHH
jgi:hypothetical protein